MPAQRPSKHEFLTARIACLYVVLPSAEQTELGPPGLQQSELTFDLDIEGQASENCG
jgi:hypothetical protein